MSIGSISSVSASYAIQAQQQLAPRPKAEQSQSGQDSVQLSQAALSALKGDADHDGDSA